MLLQWGMPRASIVPRFRRIMILKRFPPVITIVSVLFLRYAPLSLLSPLFYSACISCLLLQAAGKASFDPKATSGGVALEIAAKYLLDKDTFVKVSTSLPSVCTGVLTPHVFRAKSTTQVSPPSPTSKPSARESRSASAQASTPNVSKKQPTKSASRLKPPAKNPCLLPSFSSFRLHGNREDV